MYQCLNSFSECLLSPLFLFRAGRGEAEMRSRIAECCVVSLLCWLCHQQASLPGRAEAPGGPSSCLSFPFLDGAEKGVLFEVSWFCRHWAGLLGHVDNADGNSQSGLCSFCSCSICKKKQNKHFIVPASRFKLLKVSTFKQGLGGWSPCVRTPEPLPHLLLYSVRGRELRRTF